MNYNFDLIRQYSASEILTLLSQEEIYGYYMNQHFKIQNVYKCYFHDDSDPSMGFFESNNYIVHNCFACGSSGNVFQFVMKHLGLTYYEALDRIVEDFGLRSRNKSNTAFYQTSAPPPVFADSSSTAKTEIYPTFRGFSKVDYEYWASYGLGLEDIMKWDVRACSVVYCRSRAGVYSQYAVHSNKNPIYCYRIGDSYKIYRPLHPEKRGKWFQNCSSVDIQGMRQLSEKRDLLIITSSLKDVMVLGKMGYQAIAPHGESAGIPDKIADYLWATSDNMVVFYDSDKAGYTYGRKLADELGAGAIFIPEEYGDKDVSDYVKHKGLLKGRELMKSLLGQT